MKKRIYGDNHMAWILNPIPDRDNFVYLTLKSKDSRATRGKGEGKASTVQNLVKNFFALFHQNYCTLLPKVCRTWLHLAAQY